MPFQLLKSIAGVWLRNTPRNGLYVNILEIFPNPLTGLFSLKNTTILFQKEIDVVKLRLLRSNEIVRSGDYFSTVICGKNNAILVLGWAHNRQVSALRKTYESPQYLFYRPLKSKKRS